MLNVNKIFIILLLLSTFLFSDCNIIDRKYLTPKKDQKIIDFLNKNNIPSIDEITVSMHSSFKRIYPAFLIEPSIIEQGKKVRYRCKKNGFGHIGFIDNRVSEYGHCIIFKGNISASIIANELKSKYGKPYMFSNSQSNNYLVYDNILYKNRNIELTIKNVSATSRLSYPPLSRPIQNSF